ncbi:MAG: Smr/MutS family protein [Dehalococcoidales bacterium]
MRPGERTAQDELDLHGATVDEAIPRLDEFLHAAFRRGRWRVWIIHGKGTGTLRRAIRRHLSGHSLVKRLATADRTSGGSGVTEVELADR